jgi:type I restriction enzyme S subunit
MLIWQVYVNSKNFCAMSKPLVPEIRFGGYSEPWEYVPFSDIATTFGGLTYSPSSVVERGTLVLRSSNVQNGELTFDDNVFVRPDVVNVKNVEPGDIIMVVRNGSRALIGKHAQVKSPLPNTVIGAFMTGIKSEIPNFTTALFDSNVFNEEVRKGLGATINQITNGMLSDMHFNVCSLDEQKEIGEWFKRLDDMIANAEKEVARLERMKIASLQKMFPRPGQTTPEVRFGGFTEPWEEHKLGDITTSYSGGTPKVGIKDYYGGSIPFIRSGEIHRSSTELFITELGYKESSAAKVVKGDILFALYGATSGDVAISQIDGVINQAILAIKPNDGFSAYFITYWLEYNKNRLIDTYLQGGQGNLSGTIVKSFNLAVPTSFTEQESIGRYFFDLDNLIAKKRDRIVKLRNIKKACLEKMFVNNTTEQ